MITKFRFLFVSLCVLTISSCVSVDKSASIIDAQNRCCNQFSEVSFAHPSTNLPFIVKLNANSQAYTFLSGRSLIAAFSIPENMSKINFITSLSSAWIPSATVIIPRFLFLDAQKHEIKNAKKHSLFQYYRPFKSSSMTKNYSGTVDIPKEAKFFVIYTDRSTLGKRVGYVNYEGMAALQASPVEVPESKIGVDFGIVMSGLGSIDVELK